MAIDRFLIGYTDNNSGLETDVKPWLIADNAFARLENAYIFRGRVRRRMGSILMGSSQLESRLRGSLGLTDGAGAASGTVPGTVYAVGQIFSIGEDIFTVNATGTPATLLSTNPAITVTYNTSTGAYTVVGAPTATAVYFYPATPVMGISSYYVPATNNFTSIAFDTQFSYIFDKINNYWTAISGTAWTGTDYQQFWSVNFQGTTQNLNYLWTTNFNATDGIRYFDGTTWTQPVLNYTVGSVIDTTDGAGDASGNVPGGSGFIGQVFNIGTTSFTVTLAAGALTVSAGGTGTGTFDTATGAYTFTGAQINTSIYFTGDNQILTSRLIINFRNRLVVMNTVETVDGVSKKFVNRIRWSASFNALSPNAFMFNLPGNGGVADAPTYESIVTAQFIKDRLIVYFDNSTYELAYTGNEIAPFIFNKLNNELGAVSTFSEIPFDRQVLGIDNTGIHACNGSNVSRVDEKIPQLSFGINNAEEGRQRVCGIRDYYAEMAYWTYPDQNRNSQFYFPNKMLIYNYVNQTWAINDDTITSFGYFLRTDITPGAKWGTTYTSWEDLLILWNSGAYAQSNSEFRTIAMGNQQGFTFILQQDVTSNAPVLSITDVTSYSDGLMTISCINHNLDLGDFILLQDMNGLTFSDGTNTLPTAMAKVTSNGIDSGLPNTVNLILLCRNPDKEDIENLFISTKISGTYTGGGVASRVSQINILTKQYNFYTGEDRSIYVSKIDFLVDKTKNGIVAIDFLNSSTANVSVSDGPGSKYLETSPYDLIPLEKFQSRLWHPLYFYAEGQAVQFNFNMTGPFMFDYIINEDGTINYVALEDFQLHAMAIYTQRTSMRMQ